MAAMRWILVLGLVACGDDGNKTPDAAIDGTLPDMPIDADPNNPATLADTGRCLDAGCCQIASNVHAYTPHYQLWSDSATKRRWIYLPPGTQIDTSDMDFWKFPVGTKLWKEFTRD